MIFLCHMQHVQYWEKFRCISLLYKLKTIWGKNQLLFRTIFRFPTMVFFPSKTMLQMHLKLSVAGKWFNVQCIKTPVTHIHTQSHIRCWFMYHQVKCRLWSIKVNCMFSSSTNCNFSPFLHLLWSVFTDFVDQDFSTLYLHWL